MRTVRQPSARLDVGEAAAARTGRGKGALVGLISDTHGLLRPEAVAALRGADLILHAGDVGAEEVLRALSFVAPVLAVRGNNDRGAFGRALPRRLVVRIAGHGIEVVHDRAEAGFERGGGSRRVVVTGHSHRPCVEERDGVLFINPGAAGPRRFRLPISVGLLRISQRRIAAEIVELSAPPSDPGR